MALTKRDKKDIQEMLLENNKNLVTKDDLLENNRHIGYLIEDKINEAKDELKAEMKQHRSEIMNHIDSFAKEIKNNRDERKTQSEQILRNTKRIENLEKVGANL